MSTTHTDPKLNQDIGDIIAAAMRGDEVDLTEPAERAESPDPANPYEEAGAGDGGDDGQDQEQVTDPIEEPTGDQAEQVDAVVPEQAVTPVASPWDSLDDASRRSAVEVYQWAMQDENRALLNAVFSGQYELIPRGQQSQGQTQSPSSSSSPSPVDDSDEFDDPKAAERINQLRSEMEELRANQLEQTAARQKSEREQFVATVNEVGGDFASAHSLEPATLDAVMQAAADLGILGRTMSAHPGDNRSAIRAALDQAAWTVPAFRDAQLETQLTTRLASQTAVDVESQKRKQRAAVASSSPGSVPRVDQAQSPSTRQQREAAMAAEIAASMANR